MAQTDFMLYKGVRILYLNIVGSKDIEQNMAAYRRAQELATKEPPKSVRFLANVTDAHFTSEGVSVLKEFSKTITPYVIASANVGVTGLKKIIVQSLIKLSGRDLKLFDKEEAALEWLVNQK